MSIPWLADLEAALWEYLPQVDEAFVWQERRYLCERDLHERAGAVYFVERWRDPRTQALLHTWRLPLNPGAWVGLDTAHQARMIALLCASIAQARPQHQEHPAPAPLVPSRFGAQS
jgi:hypothetical protein